MHEQPAFGTKASGLNSGQIALTVLVVLAILASVVMLFTDNDAALKVALLAALWAAVIGFFLVFRYRSQAHEVEREADLREEAHRQELEKLRDDGATIDVLQELKEEIAGLRARLEELTGQPIGYEPSAIHADARRILEVESPSERLPGEIPVAHGAEPKERTTSSVTHPTGRHAVPPVDEGVDHPHLRVVESSGPDERGQGLPPKHRRPGMSETPDAARDFATRDFVADESAHVVSDSASWLSSSPHGDTTETPIVDVVRKPQPHPQPQHRAAGAPSAEAVAGRIGSQRSSGPNPLSALISENARRAGTEPVTGYVPPTPTPRAPDAEPLAKQRSAVSATPPVQPEPEPWWTAPAEPAPAEPAEPETTPPTARRGRRRRDENATAVSVADLMRNLEDRR